jgi:hypothetical protein
VIGTPFKKNPLASITGFAFIYFIVGYWNPSPTYVGEGQSTLHAAVENTSLPVGKCLSHYDQDWMLAFFELFFDLGEFTHLLGSRHLHSLFEVKEPSGFLLPYASFLLFYFPGLRFFFIIHGNGARINFFKKIHFLGLSSILLLFTSGLQHLFPRKPCNQTVINFFFTQVWKQSFFFYQIKQTFNWFTPIFFFRFGICF